LSPRRREYAKLPGCRHPDAAARRGQGASIQVRRWRRAGGTGFQGAGGAKGKLTEARAAELKEVLAREGFLAKPRPDRTAPSVTEMDLGFATLHQLLTPFLGGLDRLLPPQREALQSAFGLVAGPRRTGSWWVSRR
jgi:hypothetical protein